MDHFDDYQKHFTVMNYGEGVQLKQVMMTKQTPAYIKSRLSQPTEKDKHIHTRTQKRKQTLVKENARAHKAATQKHTHSYNTHTTWIHSLNLILCVPQVHYDEFIPMFEKQYRQYPWKEVEVNTHFESFTCLSVCVS